MIDIRPVKTIEESRLVENLIAAAWGGDHHIAVPDHLTVTIAKENGGVVLLAWDGENPVGFCLGFLSYVETEGGKRLKHCSHMAGVVPECRGRKVGQMLKWAQREAVLAMGIDLITWTYDPLETLNGRLNIHKLGAVCNVYERNIYGDGRDALNWGVPTDRFHVDWYLNSPRVQAHQDGDWQNIPLSEWLKRGTKVVNQPQEVNGLWQVGVIDEALVTHEHLLVAVPANYQSIKNASVKLGLAWRMHTREIFELAFAKGFVVVDLFIAESLCYYFLER
ncbi:MAG: hypothetical protein GY796_18180 [Chloroflexi bacterium]|nr:hypothetical protein [Chloroflexota bacterium]